MKEKIKNRLMRFFGLVPLRTSDEQALNMYNWGVHDSFEEIKDFMDSLYGKDPAEWAKEAYRYTEERLNEMKEVVGIKDDEGQKGD